MEEKLELQAKVLEDVKNQLRWALGITSIIAAILVLWNNMFGLTEVVAHCFVAADFAVRQFFTVTVLAANVWARLNHFGSMAGVGYCISEVFLVASLLAAGGSVVPGYAGLRKTSVIVGIMGGMVLWFSLLSFCYAAGQGSQAYLLLAIDAAFALALLGLSVVGNESTFRKVMGMPGFHSITPLILIYVDAIGCWATTDAPRDKLVWAILPSGSSWLLVLMFALIVIRTNIYDALARLHAEPAEPVNSSEDKSAAAQETAPD